MDCYSEKLERQMSRLYDSLSERDRRRYAGVQSRDSMRNRGKARFCEYRTV